MQNLVLQVGVGVDDLCFGGSALAGRLLLSLKCVVALRLGTIIVLLSHTCI